MPPDMLKKLMGNPELMEIMSNPKMQEVMTMMMTGGQDTLMKAMSEDQEVYEIVTKLNQIMGKAL
jgi:glutamine amidotransferase PdxT